MTTMGRTSRLTSALRTHIEWCAARLFIERVRRVSPQGAYRSGVGLGDLAWLLLFRRRRIARKNVRAALDGRSDAERARIVHASFRSFGRTLVEALRLPEDPPSVCWAEPDVLGPFIRVGRPAIIVSGHLGNWEVAAWAIAKRGGKLHLVIAPPHNPLIAGFFEQQRRAWGVLPHDRVASVRPLLAALKRGELVGTAADQWPGTAPSLTVALFGRPTLFGTGMFRLAAHACVPVVAVAATRTDESVGSPGSRFTITTALVWDGNSPLPSPEEMVRRWAGLLEEQIIAHPEQYLWLHRRWKAAPPTVGR